MNLKFEVENEEHMPLVDYNDMILLFDTGASSPVWTRGIKIFKQKFPDAKKMKYKYLLSGFGRSAEELVEFLTFHSKKSPHLLKWG